MDMPLSVNVAAGSGAAMQDFTKPCHRLDASVATSKFSLIDKGDVTISARIIIRC